MQYFRTLCEINGMYLVSSARQSIKVYPCIRIRIVMMGAVLSFNCTVQYKLEYKQNTNAISYLLLT